MATKNFRAWIYPTLSLGGGVGMFSLLRFGDRFIPFMGLLMDHFSERTEVRSK
jgi:hypothetical protein